MQAITAAANYIGGKYLNDCTLYVTIEPCVMCAGALAWSHITKIVYGAAETKKGFSVLEKALLHPKTVVLKGVLANDCEKIMKDFLCKKRK